MSWWSMKRIANYYGHHSREGMEVPTWLKQKAVEEIMRARSNGNGSHPTGRQFGKAAIVVLCSLLLSCQEPTDVTPVGVGCATKDGVTKCVSKADFLRFGGWYQGWSWKEVANCSECND